MAQSPKHKTFGLTWPIVKTVLWSHRRAIVMLGLVSVLMGVVPALKSELESGLFDQVSGAKGKSDWSEVLKEPLKRFDYGASAEAALPERIARFLFHGQSLGLALILYLVISLLAFGGAYVTRWMRATISKGVFSALRGEGMRKGLLTDPSRVSSLLNAPGQYAVSIQQGASNISDTYGYLIEAGQHVFALATTLLLVLSKSPKFTLFCAVVVAVQVWISLVQARRLRDGRKALDEQRNALVARTDDILTKREIILAYDQQERYGQKLDELTGQYGEVDRKLNVREEGFRGLGDLVSDYGRILILLGVLVIGLSTHGSLGDVYFFISIYVRMLVPASNLLSRYDSIRRAEATSNSFLEVLTSAEPGARGSKEPSWPKGQGPDIRFDDVSFEYIREKPVLRHLTFQIPAGTTTLLVGPSGSGKTTITRILLGFWPVGQGQVRIGGQELGEIDPVALRERVSYVSQGDHIVEDSMRENLCWGSSTAEISAAEMLEALKQVGILRKEEGESSLDRLAKELSGGQQQRLALARMMLDNSEITLLDEPLAGVDVFTIRDLMPALKGVLGDRNRTVLLISHRVAFAACAGHVIVLGGDGSLLESGSPHELLARPGGVFKSLYTAALEELQPFEASNAPSGPWLGAVG